MWLKIRSRKTGDFVVVGFTAPKGARGGFGALQLAEYVDGTLTYAGRAGTRVQRQAARGRAARRSSRSGAPTVPAPDCCQVEKDTTWVEPTMVAEVEYSEVTEEGLLRQPVFPPVPGRQGAGGVREAARGGGAAGRRDRRRGEQADGPSRRRPSRGPAARVEFTNLKKVFWPEDGYTKGDLIEYYRAVSPWLLPYLRDRPVVMTRYPDGIGGKSFFQKDAPGFRPDWIRTERMWSEDTQREIDYFVCDDEESLLYVANLGTIPLHLWASRAPTLERPDWCVLDLDPKGAPFEHVVELARAAKGAVRPDRPARAGEDHRLVGAPPDDPAGPAVHPRAVAVAGRAAGALPGGASCRRSRPSRGR